MDSLSNVLSARRRGYQALVQHTAELLDRVALCREPCVLTWYLTREDGVLIPSDWVDLLDYIASESYLTELVVGIEDPAWAEWDGSVERTRVDRGRALRLSLREMLDQALSEPRAVVDVWWRRRAQVSLVSVRAFQRLQAMVEQPAVGDGVVEAWRVERSGLAHHLGLRLAE